MFDVSLYAGDGIFLVKLVTKRFSLIIVVGYPWIDNSEYAQGIGWYQDLNE